MTGTSKQPLVLAVDDDPVNLAVMGEVLDGHFELCTADSGEQALQVAAERRPDVILLDIMMPGMDGYQTCRLLRETEGLEHCKIMLVSAKTSTQDRIDGYAAGADDYVTKPFHPSELVAKVHVFLRLKNSEEINALKSDLLNLVTHELRTPLTGLLPAAEFLCSEDELSTDDRRMWAQMIADCARRLHNWAEEGLVLCQLKAEGSACLDRAPFDISAMLREILRHHHEDLAKRQLSVHTEMPEQLEVYADRSRLRAVFGHLIDNACQHATEASTVELRVSCTGDQLRVDLRNQCPGHEAGAPDVDFGVLTPKVIEGEVVGASIKMAICREVLLAHGGDVEMVWEPDGSARVQASWPLQAGAAVV